MLRKWIFSSLSPIFTRTRTVLREVWEEGQEFYDIQWKMVFLFIFFLSPISFFLSFILILLFFSFGGGGGSE